MDEIQSSGDRLSATFFLQQLQPASQNMWVCEKKKKARKISGPKGVIQGTIEAHEEA